MALETMETLGPPAGPTILAVSSLPGIYAQLHSDLVLEMLMVSSSGARMVRTIRMDANGWQDLKMSII